MRGDAQGPPADETILVGESGWETGHLVSTLWDETVHEDRVPHRNTPPILGPLKRPIPFTRFGNVVKINSVRWATGCQKVPRLIHEVRTGRSATQSWRAVKSRLPPNAPLQGATDPASKLPIK